MSRAHADLAPIVPCRWINPGCSAPRSTRLTTTMLTRRHFPITRRPRRGEQQAIELDLHQPDRERHGSSSDERTAHAPSLRLGAPIRGARLRSAGDRGDGRNARRRHRRPAPMRKKAAPSSSRQGRRVQVGRNAFGHEESCALSYRLLVNTWLTKPGIFGGRRDAVVGRGSHHGRAAERRTLSDGRLGSDRQAKRTVAVEHEGRGLLGTLAESCPFPGAAASAAI